jgi:hypothetical protein
VKGSKVAAEMAEQPQVISALAGRRLELVERISSILPPISRGPSSWRGDRRTMPPSTAATSWSSRRDDQCRSRPPVSTLFTVRRSTTAVTWRSR